MKTMKINGNDFTFQPTTGKVLSTNKNLETKVTGHGGGGSSFRGTGFTNSVKIQSTTTIHDQLFIEDANGAEHSYQLQDFDVSCREGNLVTILAAFKGANQSGRYFAVINHSTKNTFFSEKNLQRIAAPNLFIYIGIFVVVLFLMIQFLAGAAVIAGFLLFIGLLIYYTVKMKQNVKMIKNSIDPNIYLV